MQKPILFIILFSFFLPISSHATLGKKYSLNQRQRIGIRPGFKIHEVQNSGATIREHVGQDGIVYGISWKGIAMPDLTALMGNYSAEYKEVLNQPPKILGKRARRIGTSKLRVEFWGHMRNLRGRVYDPSLLTNGVTSSEIE